MLPTRVIHADWSANPHKRWMAEAVLGDDGRYTVRAPQKIRDTGLFALTLVSVAAGGALVGFDFPIGVPLAYAREVGIDDFLALLPKLGKGEWENFYDVAEQPSEISLYRPFYPAKPGGTRRTELTDALGITKLRRRCDCRTAGRRAAAELFWTLGAQQVGKAAISGWRDILAPALEIRDIFHLRVWPFSGEFYSLLRPGWVVACETYPAEYYGQLGICFPRSQGKRTGKRVQADRAANAAKLFAFAEATGIRFDTVLCEAIIDGFGADAYGEDRFDAVVGVLGMLNVVLGRRAPGDPRSEAVARVEGWILGLDGEAHAE